MQSKLRTLILLLFLVFSRQLLAERQLNPGNVSLGLILGSPTAITPKFNLDRIHAIDAGLAYWFNDYIEIYADYLWLYPKLTSSKKYPLNEFTPYWGLGADLQTINRSSFIADNRHPWTGVFLRTPLGVEFMPRKVPLGIFLELVPNINLIPGLWISLGGGLGARYYF